MSPEKKTDVVDTPKRAQRVDRTRRPDSTPTPIEVMCTTPKCVGMHRKDMTAYLCAGCKHWHPLPCPAEVTGHRRMPREEDWP